MVPSDLRSRAARLCRLRHDPQLLFPAPAPPPLNRRDHLDCRHRAKPIVTISIALGAHSAEKQGSHQRTLTVQSPTAAQRRSPEGRPQRFAAPVMAPLICWSFSSSMFRYLLVDHAVPAMCRSLAAASLSADCPSGNAPTTRVRRLISLALPVRTASIISAR